MLPPSIFKKNAFHYLCFPSVNALILNLITKQSSLVDWWIMNPIQEPLPSDFPSHCTPRRLLLWSLMLHL